MTFSDVVEVIKRLSIDEKREIQLLLQQYLCDDRRDEMYDNYKLAQAKQERGELKLFSDVQELRQLIEE